MKNSLVAFSRSLRFLGLTALVAGSVHAQLIVNSSDRGWYSNLGVHASTNDNYAAGRYAFGDYRNFFVFDTSALGGATVVSAELRLFLPQSGFISADGSETFSIFDVSTSVASLTATHALAFSIFNDLGTGTSFGTGSIVESDEGTYLSVMLNNAFLSFINDGATPDIVALGGAVTSLSGLSNQAAFLFSGSGDPADGRSQLVLGAVPEPSTYGLIGAGALLGAVAWRRRRAARA